MTPLESARKKPLLVRFFGFILFRLVPLALLIAIVYFAVQVGQAVTRRMGEQSVYEGRRDAYAQTATALAPDSQAAAKLEPLYSRRAEGQDFFTNTPQATSQTVDVVLATNTVVPSATAVPQVTDTPAATEAPAMSETPRPLPTLLMPGNVDPQIAPPTAIPTQVPTVDRRGQDILNILLLGNDGEITDDGSLRTDTMIILSVNRSAGTIAMLSLPRDLYVYMPGWTMQRLNVAYVHGESSGWTDGGFGLMR